MTRVRSMLVLALVGLIAAAISTTAQAQRRGGGPPGGAPSGPERGGPQRGGPQRGIGITQLLEIEKVRTEVKATEEQMQKLRALREQGRPEGMRERFARFREMSEQEREKAMAEMRAEMEKRRAERDAQIAKILKPEQITRLNEIRRRVMGFDALGDREVVAALKITRDQGAKLTEIRDALREQTMNMFRRGEGGQDLSMEQRRAQMRERMQKIRQARQDALKKAVETVLNEEQQATWTKLLGAPFELSPEDLMQGRMGRGPGGPGMGRGGSGGGPAAGGPGGGGRRGGGGPGRGGGS